MNKLNPQFWSQTYPARPGYVHGSRTSRAAAVSMEPIAGSLHALVLDLFHQAGAEGLCDHELQQRSGITSVLRPRRIELTAQGVIKKSGRRRMTPSKRSAEVWILAK